MRPLLIAVVCVLAAGSASAAPFGSPLVTTLEPHGGLRGSTFLVTLRGENLTGARDLVLYQPGLEVLGITSIDEKTVRLEIAIDRFARLGMHHLRLRTATGISNLKLFHVFLLPERDEVEPNDSPESAQALAFGVTLNGSLRRGDIDVFAFDVQASQTLAFEVIAMRLGDLVIDTRLRLLSENGEVLSESEDSTLGRLDPILRMSFDRTMRVFCEVRDTARLTGETVPYRLHVGVFPRPLTLDPPGGPPGTEVFDGARAGPPLGLTDPAAFEAGIPALHWPSSDFGVPPSPIPFVFSTLPNLKEPLNAGNGEKAPAPIRPPVALNGRLESAQECDVYELELERGVELEFRSFARALRSPLDLVLELKDAQGKSVLLRDDQDGALDPVFAFKTPKTGLYRLEVRDHLGRGTKEGVYRIHVAPPVPIARTRLQAQRRQDPSALAIPRGGRAALLLVSEGLSGTTQIDVGFPGLPIGCTANSDALIPRRVPEVPVVIEAASDAALTHALVHPTFRRKDEDLSVPLDHPVTLLLTENNDPYLVHRVSKLAVAVTESLPFTIDVDPPTVPIVRNSSLDLVVRVKRQPGFDKPIQVRMLWNPPGVTSGEIRLRGSESEGRLQLSASGASPEASWKIALTGTSDLGGDVATSSELVTLEVKSPPITVEIGKVWIEPGSTARLELKISKRRDAEGLFEPEFPNLPKGVSIKSTPFDANTPSVTFEVTAEKDAPIARQKSLLLRLRRKTKEGEILQQHRGGELRIEQPTPRLKDAPLDGPRAYGTVEKPKT